jgi:hypothetical protein
MAVEVTQVAALSALLSSFLRAMLCGWMAICEHRTDGSTILILHHPAVPVDRFSEVMSPLGEDGLWNVTIADDFMVAYSPLCMEGYSGIAIKEIYLDMIPNGSTETTALSHVFL